MSNVSKSYKVSKLDKMDCCRLDNNPKEPCWGEVSIVDYIGEDEVPIFACEGHLEAVYNTIYDVVSEITYVNEPVE